MIIECPYCESKVDGVVIGEHVSNNADDPFPFKSILLKCPVCNNALLGGSDYDQIGPDEFGWSDPNRLWPQQETYISWEIPPICRNSLVEARTCYKARAYSACAVMSGRTLEGVCKYHSTNEENLAKGLEELKNKGVIDDRIYQWGETLRKHRNIGAHATENEIPKEDAKDCLDFAQAICDYIFVLNTKFERFIARQDKLSKKENKA